MDARSENLFRNKSNARNFELSSKTKVGQIFYRGNYVQSGIKQHIT